MAHGKLCINWTHVNSSSTSKPYWAARKNCFPGHTLRVTISKWKKILELMNWKAWYLRRRESWAGGLQKTARFMKETKTSSIFFLFKGPLGNRLALQIGNHDFVEISTEHKSNWNKHTNRIAKMLRRFSFVMSGLLRIHLLKFA